MAETTKQSHDTGHNIKIGKKKKKPAMHCTAGCMCMCVNAWVSKYGTNVCTNALFYEDSGIS